MSLSSWIGFVILFLLLQQRLDSCGCRWSKRLVSKLRLQIMITWPPSIGQFHAAIRPPATTPICIPAAPSLHLQPNLGLRHRPKQPPPLMAPALTSNSFRLAPGYSKPEHKSLRTTTVAAQARQNPFSFGKPKDDASSEDDAKGEGSSKANRFFVDFGKIPDAKSLVPAVISPSTTLFASPRRKDPRSVFVAGATGQAGARIAWALLRQGFNVRAGVPDLSSAQELARVASTYKIISPEESKRLNAVESAFKDAKSIAKAIGPATKVVVTVGAAEMGPSAEVTTDDALEVVRAAQLAGVGHVAVVYNSGPGGRSGQSTYNVLDGISSFFSNLFAQSQPLTLGEFLSKVAELEVSYTLIKASLTEDYLAESSYGLVVSKEGSTAGSKVSKSQIARLVADVFSNTSVAENKVVEVSTSPSASSKPIEELLSAIPEDGRRKAYAEAMVKAKAEEEALLAAEKAREAEEAAEKLEKEVKKLSEQKSRAASLSQEARQRAEEAGTSLDNFLTKAKGIGSDFSWDKLSSQLAAAVAQNNNNTTAEEKPKARIATVRGQAKARRLPPKKAVVKQPPQMPKPKPKQPDPTPEVKEVKKIFGGLFKQETIYVDDD